MNLQARLVKSDLLNAFWIPRRAGLASGIPQEGRERFLQSEGGYIDARPHRQDQRNLLHRTGP
jgi:hypothetical protein